MPMAASAWYSKLPRNAGHQDAGHCNGKMTLRLITAQHQMMSWPIKLFSLPASYKIIWPKATRSLWNIALPKEPSSPLITSIFFQQKHQICLTIWWMFGLVNCHHPVSLKMPSSVPTLKIKTVSSCYQNLIACNTATAVLNWLNLGSKTLRTPNAKPSPKSKPKP